MANARIYIKVTEPSVWEKLMDIEFDEGLGIYSSAEDLFEQPYNENSTEFMLDDEWSPELYSLEDFVREIKDAAGDECVVVSDYTDMDSDPFNYCIAAIEKIYTKNVNGEMHYKVNVNEVESWLKKARIKRSEEMLKYLAKFDGDNFDFARKEIAKLGIPLDSIISPKKASRKPASKRISKKPAGYEYYNIKDNTIIRCKLNGRKQEEIPDGIVKIADEAFSHSGVETLFIPSGVKEIGVRAFGYCQDLKSVTIAPGEHIIGGWTFEGCKALTSVTLGEGITEIPIRMFDGCESLASIVIPDGVKIIHILAFAQCPNLTSITIPSSVTEFRTLFGGGQLGFKKEDFIITAPRGSYAIEYAREKGIKYIET